MTSKSLIEEAFLAAATPNLYRQNAFSILNLSIDASAREVKRQSEKIRLQVKLAKPVSRPGQLRPLIPTQDSGSASRQEARDSKDAVDREYAIRDAVRRLTDPTTRLIEELFWFWPIAGRSGGKDIGVELVMAGDYQAAADHWRHLEPDGDAETAAIANHNLAVFHHRAALETEDALGRVELSNQSLRDLDSNWREAHRRWAILHREPRFWLELGLRIGELDDPRLTRESAATIDRLLPRFLVLLHARLLISSAEDGLVASLPRLSALIYGSPFSPEDRDSAIKIVVRPIQERVNMACEAAEEAFETDPAHADEVVRRLLRGDQIRSDLDLVDLLLPEGHPTRTRIHDQLAMKARAGTIAFANSTNEWSAAKELLTEARGIAASESAAGEIEESIETASSNAESDLRWHGPGYHEADNDLKTQLEKAHQHFQLSEWDQAIRILRACLKTWQGGPTRSLITKPLAFCLYARSSANFERAMNVNTPAWGRPTYAQVEAVRQAIRSAADDLVEALRLDPGNRSISKAYDQMRQIASQARVSIPSRPRSRVPAQPSGKPGESVPPTTKGSRPSHGQGWWAFLILLSMIGGIWLCMSVVNPPPTLPRTPTRAATAVLRRRTPTPTRTRAPTRTPTPRSVISGCFRWSEVSAREKNHSACVFGRVVRVYEASPYQQIIRFSVQPGEFLLRGKHRSFVGVSPDLCVLADGIIRQDGGYLYMDLDDPSTTLASISPGMCNG